MAPSGELTVGKYPNVNTLKRLVFPQAPSPMMTSFLIFRSMSASESRHTPERGRAAETLVLRTARTTSGYVLFLHTSTNGHMLLLIPSRDHSGSPYSSSKPLSAGNAPLETPSMSSPRTTASSEVCEVITTYLLITFWACGCAIVTQLLPCCSETPPLLGFTECGPSLNSASSLQDGRPKHLGSVG